MTLSRLRVLGAVSATALVGALFTPVALAAPVDPAPEGTQNVTVFGLNDFHGRLASTGKDLACTLETERTEETYGESIFVSAGDNIGASEFESMILDENPTIRYLNALGLDASAVGNHEFDEGIDTLQARIAGDGYAEPEFEYLGANVAGEDEPVLESYSLEELDGNGDGDTGDEEDLTIAVVGAVTEETASLVSPGGIEGITFEDQVASVEDVIASEPEVQDADVVVAAYHDGSNSSAEPGSNPGGSDRFAAMSTTEGADVVLNAHTHQTYAFQAEGGAPVVQTGSYGANLAAVTLNVADDGTVSLVDNQLVPTEDAAAEGCATGSDAYAAAADIIDQAVAEAAVQGAEVVGTQGSDITTAFDETRAAYVDGEWTYTGDGLPTKGDDRLSDSALSNLVADSMVWNTQQEDFSGSAATIGVMNPGGVRADLLHAPTGDEAAGEITYREAANVLPFANSLFTGDFTGAQVVELLEQQWQPADASRPFLALGLSENLTYTYDAALPQGERITGVFVDGEPIDPAATYTLVSASFLLPDGGDNFTVLSEGTNYADSGLTDLQGFTDYLAAHDELAADYQAHGVETVVDEAAGTLTLRNLDVTSLGAPQIDEAILAVDGTEHRADYTENPETGDLEATFDYGAWDLPAGEHPVTLVGTDPATGTTMPLGALTIDAGAGDGADDAPGRSDDPGRGGGTGAPGDGTGQGAGNANDRATEADPGQGPRVGLSSETSDDRLL